MRDLAPCCICGHSDREMIYPSRGGDIADSRDIDPYSGHYQINRCGGCELIYSSPIFEESVVRGIYENYNETNVAEEEVDNVRRTMQGYYRLAAPFLRDRQRILDIGCDIGLFLEVARDDGFARLYGLEPVAVA